MRSGPDSPLPPLPPPPAASGPGLRSVLAVGAAVLALGVGVVLVLTAGAGRRPSSGDTGTTALSAATAAGSTSAVPTQSPTPASSTASSAGPMSRPAEASAAAASTPEEALQSVVRAQRNQDLVTGYDLLCSPAKAQISLDDLRMIYADSRSTNTYPVSATASGTKITGDTATMTATVVLADETSHTGTAKFVREQGRWKNCTGA